MIGSHARSSLSAITVLSAVVSAALPVPAWAQEVDLRPRFEPGTSVRYTLEQNSSSKTGSDRDKTKNTSSQMDQTIWLSMRTLQVDPSGVATVEVTYERIKLAIDSGEFKASFDSADTPGQESDPTNPVRPAPGATPPTKSPTKSPTRTPARPQAPDKRTTEDRENAEMLAQVVRPMLGSKLTLTIDAAGNILSATGGSELAPSSLVGLDGMKSLPTRGNAGLLGPIFTAKKSTGRARVGETWTSDDSLDASSLGSMRMHTTHTLRSVTGNLASVDLAGSIDKSSESASGPVQIKDSSFAGRYKWDTERGQLDSMDLNQSVSVDISVEGMSLTSSYKARTRLTRLPGESSRPSTREPAPTTPHR